MVQARPVRLYEGNHVMVTAVNAMHEGDQVTGAVGQPQAENVPIKGNGPRNVGNEQQ